MSLGILCPGQGEQGPGMFDILPGDGPGAEVLAQAVAIIGEDPRAIPADRLAVNAVAQPVLCTHQLATWAALEDRLPQPRVFAGYSVGELAAHGCAGTFDRFETIRLAIRRAAAMDEASPEPGGLVAVRGLSRPDLQRLCADRGVEIAIVNGLDRLVVGGPSARLDEFAPELTALGAKVTRLRVAVASHTSLMAPAVARFRATLEHAAVRNPAVPVLAGIDGTPVASRDKAIHVLAAQLACTVDWAACMDGLAEMGCSVLLELGPGSALSRMARERLPGVPARSVSEFRTLDGVIGWVERML